MSVAQPHALKQTLRYHARVDQASAVAGRNAQEMQILGVPHTPTETVLRLVLTLQRAQ